MPEDTLEQTYTLAELNQWVVDVTKGLNGGQHDIREQGAEAQMSKHVRSGVRAIKSVVSTLSPGAQLHAVTVRSSYRQFSTYMRPVYSEPPELGLYIEIPRVQKPFSFTTEDNDQFRDVKLLAGDFADNPGDVTVGVYTLGSIKLQTEKPQTCFSERIEEFWSCLDSEEDRFWMDVPKSVRTKVGDIKSTVPKNSVVFCLFAIRRKNSANHHYETDMLVAHYFSLPAKAAPDFYDKLRKKETRPEPASVEKLNQIAKALFTGIDLIQNVDASIFRSRGMELISQLVPVFDRKTVSPADKIAFAIERLKKVLGQHLIGRYGAELGALQIHYIMTSFELKPKGPSSTPLREYHPLFRIYPSLYAEENPLGAIRVSHPEIVSAIKFLLYRYLKSAGSRIMDTAVFESFEDEAKNTGDPLEEIIDFDQKWTNTTEEFEKRLSTLNTPNLDGYLKRVCPKLHPEGTPEHHQSIEDTLILSENDHVIDAAVEAHNNNKSENEDEVKSLWDCLNKQINPDKPNRSLVAFVIEGSPLFFDGDKVQLTQLPRGILVIESNQIDPFTDTDLQSLRAVVRGFAALIRRITNDNSSLDFRSALLGAQQEEPEHDLKDTSRLLFHRLLFSARKIDVDLLKRFLTNDESSNIQEDEFTLSPRSIEVLKDEFTLCSGSIEILKDLATKLPDGRVNGKYVSGQSDVEFVLARRVDIALGIINKVDYENIKLAPLLNFLEAFPENEAYNGYFSSISHALGSRISIDGLPTFQLLKRGFSAVGIYSAQTQSELLQVVKLSSSDKILKELINYRKHVRYKILLSARIAADGFAFDNKGKLGYTLGGQEDRRLLGQLDAEYAREAYGVLLSDLVTGETPSSDANSKKTVVRTMLICSAECYKESSTDDVVHTEESTSRKIGPAAEMQYRIKHSVNKSVAPNL